MSPAVAGLLPSQVDDLKVWLNEHSITVPEGWLEACIDWLAEEHGIQQCSRFSAVQWCDAVFEQWLHTDLCQLGCPILPDDAGSQSSEALLMEGELCLQICGVLNIGDSFYGQLRRIDGDLSEDLPDLERNVCNDTSGVEHSVSTQIYRHECIGAQTFALYLTDGLTTIKAIELGFSSHTAHNFDLQTKFLPGSKVRLRGPLKIRKGVLILPYGSISSARQSPESQLCVLGGEVESLTADPLVQKSNFIRKMMLKKLGLPTDVEPPSWFPGRKSASGTFELSTSLTRPQIFEPPVRSGVSEGASSLQDIQFAQPLVRAEPTRSHEEVIFEETDDEMLLATVMDKFETAVPAASDSGTSVQKIGSLSVNYDRDIEDEIDPDLLESALLEVDFSPRYTSQANQPFYSELSVGTIANALSEQLPCRALPDSGAMLPAKRTADYLMNPSLTTSNTSSSDFLRPKNVRRVESQLPSSKRPAIGARHLLQDKKGSIIPVASDSCRSRPPFTYLQDIYLEVQRKWQSTSNIGGNGPKCQNVYTVRGILVSLQSRLERNNGESWSLTVRLSDGSATLDADLDDELLQRLIGISCVEGEAMRQMGQQGDETQRRRLKQVLSEFQDRLCHLSGIFEVIIPSSSLQRPRIINYRALDGKWLQALSESVLADIGE